VHHHRGLTHVTAGAAHSFDAGVLEALQSVFLAKTTFGGLVNIVNVAGVHGTRVTDYL
jgi:hypothetical protein